MSAGELKGRVHGFICDYVEDSMIQNILYFS